jgi:hypothetical protein
MGLILGVDQEVNCTILYKENPQHPIIHAGGRVFAQHPRKGATTRFHPGKPLTISRERLLFCYKEVVINKFRKVF